MRTIVKGRHGEPLSDGLREYIERKMNRLDRIAHRQAHAVVEIRSHDSHSAHAANVANVSLVLNGEVLRSESTGETPQAAFDTVLDKLERQIVRHNEKPRVRDKAPAHGGVETADFASTREATVDDGPAPRIVKVKRFDIEPMFEEDALARMEELGHAFFVFLNAETDSICVLYRRAEGNYGLIEPQVGAARERRFG